MGSEFSKTEKLLAGLTIMVILVFLGLFTLVNKRTNLGVNFATETGINYKMARPDQAFSEYTLEGRELDQVYEGLPKEVKKDLSKRKLELIAKKNAEDKKKVETKKANDTKKKQELAAKSKEATKQQAKKVQEQSELAKRINSQDVAPTVNNTTGAVFSNNNNTVNGAGAEEVKVKAKKTYAEWRNQIFTAQSSEVVTQYIVAHRKNEVTATEYQAMAQDLLDQEDNKLKGLGLMLLRSVPSLASLSQLVHAQASLPTTYQSYVEQSYNAYFYPQNVNFLNAALKTTDNVLLAKVLILLQTKLSSLSQGDQSVFSDVRNSRSSSATTTQITMNTFVSLLPSLNALGAKPDSEYAGVAQQIAALIQSQNNIAQN